MNNNNNNQNSNFKFLGFHPQLSHPVQDTKAVQLATQRHFALYNKIAARNSDPNYSGDRGHPKETEAVGKSACISII